MLLSRTNQKPIPSDFKLNGGQIITNNRLINIFYFKTDLSPEDVKMLASQISAYPENAVKAFKNEVDDPIGSLALPEDKAKWWCVLMTIITRWMTERTHKESTKTIMAKILIKLHAIFKDTREVRFKELARRLDFQGKKSMLLLKIIYTLYLSFKQCGRRDNWNICILTGKLKIRQNPVHPPLSKNTNYKTHNI